MASSPTLSYSSCYVPDCTCGECGLGISAGQPGVFVLGITHRDSVVWEYSAREPVVLVAGNNTCRGSVVWEHSAREPVVLVAGNNTCRESVVWEHSAREPVVLVAGSNMRHSARSVCYRALQRTVHVHVRSCLNLAFSVCKLMCVVRIYTVCMYTTLQRVNSRAGTALPIT